MWQRRLYCWRQSRLVYGVRARMGHAGQADEVALLLLAALRVVRAGCVLPPGPIPATCGQKTVSKIADTPNQNTIYARFPSAADHGIEYAPRLHAKEMRFGGTPAPGLPQQAVVFLAVRRLSQLAHHPRALPR